MRRAIAGDFAALEGGQTRVIVTLDSRLDDDPGPWMVERIGGDDPPHRVLDLARDADFTVLIAPETTGVLETLLIGMRHVGARWLGASIDAVALARDKAALGEWLTARGIDTPPCRRVIPSVGLPADAIYPAILKPVDGAGTVDTYVVDDPANPPGGVLSLAGSLLQPYVEGRAMSACFLVDSGDRAWPIAVGEQRIERIGCQLAYRGGKIPTMTRVDERPLAAAVEAVPGLRGFVGVDFIWDEARRRTTVLEINPRPTTSIVGLLRLLPPGHLAAAWLGACDPKFDGAALLAGLRDRVHSRRPVAFDASGDILAPGVGG